MNSFTRYYKVNVIMLMFLFFAGNTTSNAQKIKTYNNGVLQGALKIKLMPELQVSSVGLKSVNINGYANVGINNIDVLNQEYKAVKMERLFRYSPKYETRHQKHGLHLWYKVEVNSEEDIKEVLKAYKNVQEIEQAELFYEKKLIPYNITVLEEAMESISKTATASPFDDPRLGEQWHYSNTGQIEGLLGADINLFKAWEKQAGSPNVIVSIIDQGVDYRHEDLNANMWINEAELNGTPGEDSDGNGYIDDIYGYNFAEDKGDVDPLSHGTHVGGTVAAVNNNGIGVAGVAGGTGNGDGARIMSCQIMGESSFGLPEEAFVYAADNGSVISQNSWGYNEPDIYEQSIIDAIDYYIEEAGNYPGSPMKGGVVIFASGNLGAEGLFWPGCYEKVIAVAATGPYNEAVSYTNYGDWIDVSAPGGNVDYGQNSGVLSTMPDNSYGFYDGTSMACPHVSGIAALIVSEFGGGDFDNEMLKERLLGGVNVIDTLEYNNHWIGKMGVGAVDAYLALQKDEGIAPEVITDLKVLGSSQSFSVLQWTVPVDTDDEQPRYFDVFFAKESIGESNLSTASRIRVESSQIVGTLFSYELSGLDPLTNYYFVVKGVDRWGNVADISNQVNVATNNGPAMELTPELISFSIDAAQDTLAQKQFSIFNNGEGILKWSLEARHVENEDIYDITIDPLKVFNVSPMNATLPKVNYKPLANAEATIDLFAQVPTNEWLFYFDEVAFYSTIAVIGESNLELPNSSATHFTVGPTEGFNLTTVEVGMGLQTLTELPVVIEIKKGKDITTAKRIYTQEYFLTSSDYFIYKIDLNEQIYFNTNEEFWLVVHIPPGQENPLMASQGINYEATSNSYYSSNLGNTWSLLRDVYYDYTKVWVTTAWSELEGFDSYIKLSPTTGYVTPGESEVINVDVNATHLINGDYKSNIVVYNNVADADLGNVTLEFDVSGHRYELVGPDITDYSSVFIGETASKVVTIKNVGLGAFASNGGSMDIEISHPDFTLISSMFSVIPSEREASLTFKYKPTSVGAANAVVTITEQNGEQYKFSLYGVGAEPALARVNPEDTYHTGLNLGDQVADAFYLHNDGAFPLRYYVPKFADGSNMPDFDARYIHKYGYAAVTNIGDEASPAFDWIDISETGTDIAQAFRINSALTYQEALVGFQFPFFGTNYDTCYISNWGTISFSNDGWFNSNPASYNNSTQASQLVCAWGMPFYLGDGGKILYQQFPDKFIVQYDNVPHGTYFFTGNSLQPIDWHNVNVTFQIVLHNDGSIEYNYKDLGDILNTTDLGYNRASCLLCIEDADLNDGLILNGYGSVYGSDRKTTNGPTAGCQVYFKSPGYGVIETLTNSFGTISVGDSVKLEYTANTESLFVDDFEERINIISNDPINNLVTHSVNLNITTGGERNIQFTPEVVDFGPVFQGAEVSLSLKVTNTGKASATFTDSAFVQGNFSINGYIPVLLKSNTFTSYIITFNAQTLGVKDDVLVLTDEEGTTYQIPVKATVVEAPYISADKPSLDLVLNSGEKTEATISVINTGKNPMLVSPVANEWLMAYPSGISEQSTAVNYVYSIDKDPSSIYYNWLDITETGERLSLPDPFDEENFWNAVALDTSFPYYGEKYDTIYVGHTGIITFTKGQEGKIFGPSEEIPDTTGVNNFIAPLFGLVGASSVDFYPNTGIYVKQYADKTVVLYHEISNGFQLGQPVSFEVVLYHTGVIKFMYNFTNDAESQSAEISLVGIENKDGSKGIQVINRTKEFLYTGTTITFVPHEYYQVEASSTQVFNVAVSAESLYDGVYAENLLFKNNTPSNPDFYVPVNLQVNGTNNIIVEDTLALGELLMVDHDNEGYTSPYKKYDFDFTLNNIGTRALNISSVKLLKGFNYGITMGDDSKFGLGTSADGWIDISRRIINYTLRPQNTETFRLRVFPLAEATIADTIMVYCDVEGGAIKIPVSAIFSLPAKVGYPSTGINVYAPNYLYTEDKKLSIDNEMGNTTLKYNVELSFERDVTNSSVSVDSPIPMFVPQSNQKEFTTLNTSALKSGITPYFNYDDYNRVLEYDKETASTQTIGYGDGGGQSFHTGTGFYAPEDGFNLTHVMLWYAWGDIVESDIEVQIYGGADDLQFASLLYSQVFHHKASSASSLGDYITIELDEAQLFFPKEKFFLVFKFPSEVPFPQGTATVSSNVLKRYYFGNGTVYFDMVEQGYSSMALLMKAAELEPGSNVWAVLNSENSGELAVGESVDFDLTFIAQFAKQGINTGQFIINSSDPYNPTVSVPLTLTHNKGPQYADGNNVYYSIAETDTLNYKLIATDDEGDAFTLTVPEEYPYVEYTINNNQVDIQFTPDYDGAGMHIIKVIGEDSFGNSTTFTLNVNVDNVNRAPIEENKIGEVVVVMESEEGYILNLDFHITDPDGDELTYFLSYENTDVVEMLHTGSTAIFMPKTLGYDKITLIATDPMGAKLEMDFPLFVEHRVGVDDRDANQLKVYPNPASNQLFISVDVLTEVTKCSILDASGQVLLYPQLTEINNEFSLQITTLKPGMYILKVETNSGVVVRKFIKR